MTKSRLDDEKAEIRYNARAQVEFWRNDGDKLTALPWTRDQITPQEFRQWVASRKEAGREIDIETCEFAVWYALDFDPYDADPDLPEVWQQSIGKNQFVRPPGAADGFTNMTYRTLPSAPCTSASTARRFDGP
jgi:hypothetical protein